MLCKNLRSPFKNNALCCFFTAFESPNIVFCKTKNSPCWVSSLFWRRMGDIALDFCKARSKAFLFMLCKNLRSPFKNSALCCFFTAFESPNIVLCKTKKHPLTRMLSCFGGGWGIRTLVPVKANGFQDRLVMTTSIILRANIKL